MESLKLKRENTKKAHSKVILELEEKELKDEGTERNNDVRTKPLFVWMLKTPVEKNEKDVERKTKKNFNETVFNVTDHDLSSYRNAHLVGKTSTIFVKGIDINAMEEDIKKFFLDIEKPMEIHYKYDENGE